MTVVKMPIALICTFLWIGFVCAISFMEAWLKFRAPGISVPLGLGIGRLVFNALFAFPVILLFIQTFWLLPALDARAELHIQGKIVPPSNLHFYYVGIELLKVASLTFFGLTLFKNTTI